MEYDTEPRLLAIDCEMCATATDDKALLSLCMVDTEGTAIIHVRSRAPPAPSRAQVSALLVLSCLCMDSYQTRLFIGNVLCTARACSVATERHSLICTPSLYHNVDLDNWTTSICGCCFPVQ